MVSEDSWSFSPVVFILFPKCLCQQPGDHTMTNFAVVDPGGGACPPPPPKKKKNANELFIFCIRMLQNKAHIVLREHQKKNRELPGSALKQGHKGLRCCVVHCSHRCSIFCAPLFEHPGSTPPFCTRSLQALAPFELDFSRPGSGTLGFGHCQ